MMNHMQRMIFRLWKDDRMYVVDKDNSDKKKKRGRPKKEVLIVCIESIPLRDMKRLREFLMIFLDYKYKILVINKKLRSIKAKDLEELWEKYLPHVVFK